MGRHIQHSTIIFSIEANVLSSTSAALNRMPFLKKRVPWYVGPDTALVQ